MLSVHSGRPAVLSRRQGVAVHAFFNLPNLFGGAGAKTMSSSKRIAEKKQEVSLLNLGLVAGLRDAGSLRNGQGVGGGDVRSTMRCTLRCRLLPPTCGATMLNVSTCIPPPHTTQHNIQHFQLLERIAPLKRGLIATPEDVADVEALASELERLNPTRKPLARPDLLSAKWELRYTTSSSILGTTKPGFLRPSGPIYQYIDAEGLRAKNQESAPLYNSVTAELTPLSDSKVKVQFKVFKLLNLVSVKAPERAVGELDVTFLDDELRISRGDKGNLFILTAAERGPGAAF